MSREQGAEAELRAELTLRERGFNTSRPTSELTYDLIAEKSGTLVSIQVKSTTRLDTRDGKSQYTLSCRRSDGSTKKRRYRPGEFDFLLAYVQPENVWYVVPFEEIKGETLVLFPHRQDVEGQYEQYKERWELLSDHKNNDSRGCCPRDGEAETGVGGAEPPGYFGIGE